MIKWNMNYDDLYLGYADKFFTKIISAISQADNKFEKMVGTHRYSLHSS